jgi:hypothetical protein
MKKNIKKLQLKKKTIVNLNNDAKQMLHGGAGTLFTCPFTVRFCPTPPQTSDCKGTLVAD